MKRLVVGILSIGALGFLSGCAVEHYDRERVAVSEPEVLVPEYYVWDGAEYVGVVHGRYVYMGPGNVWRRAEPYRVERFHEWERYHPDWQRNAIRNEQHAIENQQRNQEHAAENQQRNLEHAAENQQRNQENAAENKQRNQEQAAENKQRNQEQAAANQQRNQLHHQQKLQKQQEKKEEEQQRKEEQEK